MSLSVGDDDGARLPQAGHQRRFVRHHQAVESQRAAGGSQANNGGTLNDQAADLERKKEEVERVTRVLDSTPFRHDYGNIIGRGRRMKEVLLLLDKVIDTDMPVLVEGESGTGKELIAKAIHHASRRARAPFVAVNCGAVPETLLESELFGHVKGAFTDAKTERAGRFEVADGGTLFLDEIGALTMPQQAKLLRVLQTGEFERVGSSKTRRADVRVLCATNTDLQTEVQAGRFREDLLFRINTIEIRLPPLRDRREDIPLLGAHFLRRYAARSRKAVSKFPADAMQALLAYHWPGNVRELEHTVERAVLLAEGDAVRGCDLSLRGDADGAARIDQMSLEEVERLLIQKALARCDGNVTAAAKALGLSRSAMYRRMEHHKL